MNSNANANNNNNNKLKITDITTESESDSRITLSESTEEAFKDDKVIPVSIEKARQRSAAKSAKSMTNKMFPLKLPPIKRIKIRRKTKVNPDRAISPDGFEISWRNLSYFIEKSTFPSIPFKKSTPQVRVILKCLSGSFRSSQMTAILGPSGAGKSTLLACVCGQRTTGITGDIKVIGCERIKVSIVSQNDYLSDRLSLREALVFASKAKNGRKRVDHNEIVNNVVNSLSLESCLDTRLGKCSGGQRRRISIGLELVSNPNILILDEPTSGLDSASCFQIIENLKELTQNKKNPMAIVVTIHQPSARVFNMFHSIYVLSHDGQCIYQGLPETLVEHLSKFNLLVPEYHNPADYMSEIASGEYGDECITKLATNRKELVKFDSIELTENFNNLSKLSQKHKFPILLHLFLLIKRSFVLTVREPHLSWIRLSVQLVVGILIGLIYGSDLGRLSGCPPRKDKLYSSKPTDLYKDFEYEQKIITENLGSIFFNVIYFMFGGIMPMVLVFPNDVNVLIKQYTNGWYSVVSYYVSKMVIELPLLCFCTVLYLTLWYQMTAQIDDLWRYLSILLIGLLVHLISQSLGMICSAIFSTDPVNAGYLGMVATTPFYLLSGFFVRTKRIPTYLRPLTYLSYTKYGFESMVISIYGYDRCWYADTNQTLVEPSWLKFLKKMTQSNLELMNDNDSDDEFNFDDTNEAEELANNDILAMFSGSNVANVATNPYQSMVMSQLGFTDDMLPFNLYVLTLFALVFQLTAYFVLLSKVKKSK